MVGLPGCGKTTRALRDFPDYTRISQDEQGAHHFNLFKQAIDKSQNVIVDRCNHTKDQRSKYLDYAKASGYKTTLLVMQGSSIDDLIRAIGRREDHPTIKKDADNILDILATFKLQYQRPRNNEADEVWFNGLDKIFCLDMVEDCEWSRVFVVGDLHGMYDELTELLKKAGYKESEDVLLFAGDLIDRGPKIAHCIDYKGKYGTDSSLSVMGNHDYKFLRYLLGRNVNTKSIKETIEQTKHLNQEVLKKYFLSMPFMIRFRDDSYICHAGVDARYGIQNQSKDALMYTRELTMNGSTRPWYKFWEEYDRKEEIFFGHEVLDKIDVAKNCYAMDGGACFGLELRVAVCNTDGTKEFYTQKATRTYADHHLEKEADKKESKANMLEKYEEKVKLKLLNKKEYKNLVLYNYSPKCVYEKAWDETTRKARGIVFDKDTGELVGWSFDKFFNVNEMEETQVCNLPLKDGYDVYEKVDGSLVNLYYNDTQPEWIFSTRGSFESEQAKKAKAILAKTFEDYNAKEADKDFHLNEDDICKDYSYSFEVIYPSNRMNDGARLVIDYGNVECLVGLAIYNKHDKVKLPYNEAKQEFERLGFRAAKKFEKTLEEVIQLQKTLDCQHEGFVLVFTNGLMVKFKTEEYIRMNKILNSINLKSVWEVMENGLVPEKYMMSIPEEIREEVEGFKKELELAHTRVYIDAVDEQKHQLPPVKAGEEYNKTVGLFLRDNAYKFRHFRLIFPFLNKQEDVVHKLIKDIIKPKMGE
jgi:predicted kinase